MSLLAAIRSLQGRIASRLGRNPRFIYMTPEMQEEIIYELEAAGLSKAPTPVAALDTLYGMRVGVRPYGALGWDIYIDDRTDA